MRRHPSFDDRFDPAVRIVDHDPAWAAQAAAALRRIAEALGPVAVHLHLHVCAAGSDEERRHLAVRDFLRTHPDEAATYEALKRRLAERHPRDRLAYIAGKDAFVAALEARALAWAG